MTKYLTGTIRFIWDFVVGDTPEIAAGVVVIVGVTTVISNMRLATLVFVPCAILALLYLSVQIGRAKS